MAKKPKSLHGAVVEKRFSDLNELYEHRQEIDVINLTTNNGTHQVFLRDADELRGLNRVLSSSIGAYKDTIKVQVRGKTVEISDSRALREKLKQDDPVIEKFLSEHINVERNFDELLVIPSSPVDRPSLASLLRLNDLIPSPKVRKTLGKMIADQMAHVAGLHTAGRYKAAKIAAAGTWALWLWYVLKSPVTSLLSAAKRVVG